MLIVGSTTTDAGSTSSNTYLGPYLTTQSTTTEGNVQQIMPVAGTISNLVVSIGTAPGVGKKWDFTIHKNGLATAPLVTCKIEGIAKSCTSTGSATFAAGDLISLGANPENTPSKWGSARWSLSFTE